MGYTMSWLTRNFSGRKKRAAELGVRHIIGNHMTLWVKIPVIVNGDDHKTVHKWCRAQPGRTKFYHHYAGRHWWFENEQDAIMFKLRWGEYVR